MHKSRQPAQAHPMRVPHVPRILVVDDMPDNLFLMKGLLQDRYDVVEARSGREALAAVMSPQPPDMVLLDIMMPDMDGYEVLRRMRQHTPSATIPVIFLTALASLQDERLGLELGAVDYLTKPVDPARVVERIEQNVRAATHNRQMEQLSEKLARHLPEGEWQSLFSGPDHHAISFEQKLQTVLLADAPDFADWSDGERASFTSEVQWLAARHHGTVDAFSNHAAEITFDEPAASIRMAMDLQRESRGARVRVGIHTGMCEVAVFPGTYGACTTLLEREPSPASALANTAALGSVAVSPETYALVREGLDHSIQGCLLTEEFQDSDLAQVCLTPAPALGEGFSTFAGLGR